MIKKLKDLFLYNLFGKNKDEFSYWRIRIFYTIYLGYIFYYFSRGSFRILGTVFTQQELLSKEELGLILSSFNIFYAISKFLSGMLVDVFSPRYIMTIGLFITGIINLLLANSYSFKSILILWSLNGFFQGFGWPPVSKFLTKWYSKKERGTWWGLWSTSHNIGDAIIPQIIILALRLNNIKLGFYIPALFSIFFSIILFERLRDNPNSIGLPSIEKYKNDDDENEYLNKKRNISFISLLVKYVFKNFYIWLLITSSFFLYLVRFSINPWIKYFFEDKGYENSNAVYFFIPLEIGGFFGSFASGLISDKIFKGKRSLTNVLFCFGLILSLTIFWKNTSYNIIIDSILIGSIGFWIYGIQTLLGIVVAEVAHKEAISTSIGFAGMWSYFATILPNIYIPKIGWNTYFIILIVFSVISLIFLLPLVKYEYKNSYKKYL